ncbi:hypothetical protein GC173_11975 [bacterium]|nr:hypothetical protein [bacterium]
MKLTTRFFVSALALLTMSASAEYKAVFTQDFESAEWPNKLEHGHNSSPYTTQLTRLEAPLPEDLFSGIAPSVVGKQAIRFQPLVDDPHLSVINRSVLSREKLGANGAAIYQVDFFLDAESPTNPRIALLAQASDPVVVGSKKVYRFYRFGLDEKGRVYFSFTNETPTPVIFLQESITNFDLKRPGWHRFQMVFKGQDQIFCLIDGRPTSYSPITESTLNFLAAGIMVTRTPGAEDPTIFADNLSIYWSENKDDALPPSPWVGAGGGMVTKVDWNTPAVNWLTSTSEAWKASQESKRVMVVLFHDDSNEVNTQLVRILGTPEAQAVLSKCTPLRLNVATPGGRKVADSFQLATAPALMVCGADGKPIAQTYIDVAANPTWNDIYSKLRVQTAVQQPGAQPAAGQ